MICFQRDEGTDPVPGCSGTGTGSDDYCVIRLPNMLFDIDNEVNLVECEGDCDEDEDCIGDLVCQQRVDFEEVLGCLGKGEQGTDYCARTALSECEADCDNDDQCEVCTHHHIITYMLNCSQAFCNCFTALLLKPKHIYIFLHSLITLGRLDLLPER